MSQPSSRPSPTSTSTPTPTPTSTSTSTSTSTPESRPTNRNRNSPGVPTPSPFTTTTDVLNKLNAVMQRYHPHSNVQDTDDDEHYNKSSIVNSTSDCTPAFQLQRRLPNGTTRQASPEELQAADLEAKIKQVAEHVANLPNDDAKTAFCEEHRMYGNQLYAQQQYTDAVDVYLTCLTAIPPENRGQQIVFLKVMNNLAQTSLTIGWYRKAQDFCRLALDEVQSYSNSSDSTATTTTTTIAPFLSPQHQLQIAKLYFRRGKASRYRGEYTAAHKDLKQASCVLEHLKHQSSITCATSSTNTAAADGIPSYAATKETTKGIFDDSAQGLHKLSLDTIEASMKAVQKELQCLQIATQEGRKNHQRHRQAMQQLFQRPRRQKDAGSSNGENDDNNDGIDCIIKEETDYIATLESSTATTRSFSTLRAPPSPQGSPNSLIDNDETDILPEDMSVFQTVWWYYIKMIGRMAEKLLEWIGDDDDDDENLDNDYPAQLKHKDA